MLLRKIAATFFLCAVAMGAAAAQNRGAGSIKGKVKVEAGTPAGVAVVVRRGEQEVTRVATDKGGSFVVSESATGNLRPDFSQGGIECWHH